ncbi:amino acid aminotransferase [Blochmannia endosymbiont of Polyrhachis (Hedomyrma) turneri]|uniref:amino acid aminotransferase n=1 Tax=Blochmannia endosymbiont of Polyrhachis (Hedomyrma) turneri TaxID=1505596 RepID=UPI00061A63C2|nr:amino acid aminotransferase [Blochmannia endosymbiont of Polyrhachis (Hedomyrma) turneri]AKC59983.1 Aspartate aminotransferase [Blochmannia endosymbiont of Polyrhachis (Hedomyrma) turneri]
MFEHIQLATPDPILGLLDIISTDQRPNKINLGIGIYQDQYGNTPILKSVKKAELFLLNSETTKNYLNIEGNKDFNKSTQKLLFGIHSPTLENRMKTVQTPGGTGALRIAADFLKKNTNIKRVWISDPSWTNHKNIFHTAGFEIIQYPYYDYDMHTINFNKLFDSLSHAQSKDLVIFHGCCHNPTGTDPNHDQWKLLSDLSLKNNWLPLFDFAYQGFSENLQQDLTALHIFSSSHQELIVCNSYSKNFSLYNERVGACTLISENEIIANKVHSQLKCIIRSNYSNPPSHGASVVNTILNNNDLKNLWEQELKNMCMHIKKIRQLFTKTLNNFHPNKDFNFINKQTGMFSFLGLHKQQVQQLQKESGIYMPNSGRINICGITQNNINYLCEKLSNVI